MTEEVLTREAWRRNRGTYLGGSDVAAIMGLSPYRTAAEVWLEKVRAQEKIAAEDETPDPEMENRFTRWGQRQESVILDEYRDVTGYEVRRPGLQLFRHPEHPFIAGTIDAEATTEFGDLRTVEAKTTDAFYQARERVWGEAETDQVPDWFIPQAVQYMLVRAHLGYATQTDFAVLIGGNDWRLYHVAFDERLADEMIEIQKWFWRLIIDRVPPPVDFTAKNAVNIQRRIYDKIVGETRVLTDPAEQRHALNLIFVRDSAHQLEEAAKKKKDAAVAELLGIAGNYGRVEIPVEGQKKPVAIVRRPKNGYHVDEYDVEPSVTLTYEPYQLKKRKEVFDAIIKEEGAIASPEEITRQAKALGAGISEDS